MKKIGIIIGATRPNRIGKPIADYVLSKAPKDKFSYELIDLKEVNLPLLDEAYPAAYAKYEHQHTISWSKLVSEYSGFIIVTPEYNASCSAALKNALDYLYNEWVNKPVGLIGYGYSASGGRAIMQLRPILANLQMKTLAKEVLVNLPTHVQDNKFTSNETLDKNLATMFSSLEEML
ncbi:MAG: NADPH-dependent oxidoreductase [Neisseriaceae bacterium]|jgi:NAD(P)H-dependent FMN reductase|nr:MAG: NADPH-dependent oxidoreductase [Neisseriaceae bacterium]